MLETSGIFCGLILVHTRLRGERELICTVHHTVNGQKKSVQSGACSHLIAFIALTGLPIIASIQLLIKKEPENNHQHGIYIPT